MPAKLTAREADLVDATLGKGDRTSATWYLIPGTETETEMIVGVWEPGYSVVTIYRDGQGELLLHTGEDAEELYERVARG